MRPFFHEFLVDNLPVLTPDGNIKISRSDLTSSDSGTDALGYMHRFVLRDKLRTWQLPYSHLTHEEYRYMASLFEGKEIFEFHYRGLDGQEKITTAYCASDSIAYVNAVTGLYENYTVTIKEC